MYFVFSAFIFSLFKERGQREREEEVRRDTGEQGKGGRKK